MKKVLMPLVFVWVAGAFAMSIYYDIQRKANCIEQEGFLKGWLWCKSDPISRMEFASNRIELFILGLAWPVRLFEGNSAEPESRVASSAEPVGAEIGPPSTATVATEEQFRSAMCALQEMPRDVRVNLQGAVRGYFKDRDESKMVKAIEIDDVPFHLSDCFKRYAIQTMAARTSKDDFKHFYSASERAMILALMIDAMRAMPDAGQLSRIGNEARMEVQRRNERYYQ